ncbi:Xaa-Pro dipeptidyl-peptidase [Pseudonocardiaceae bacterium YIM PH 21723]|nr:Xaa-Pro dipeptidyl-peptidase [Pseudonocardiaceae bacterium YIM PH 21723]
MLGAMRGAATRMSVGAAPTGITRLTSGVADTPCSHKVPAGVLPPERDFMRKVFTGVLAAALLTTVLPGAAIAAPQISVKDGVSQPVFSFADAIKEKVFVESSLDSDGDGKKDRVAVNLSRPKETQQGLKVSVIMHASPYFGGLLSPPLYDPPPTGDADPNTSRDAQLERSGARAAARIPGVPAAPNFYYDNYFVPRGYGFMTVDMAGSRGSEGCPVTGGRSDVESVKSVIDWLNGRAKAFTADGKPVKADWTTGKVGMIGVSYDGTLPNGVAATGVQGLKTIVPIGAISSWYDHYRAGGSIISTGEFFDDADWLARAVLTGTNKDKCAQVVKQLVDGQSRATGDYNAFWDERNYRNDADNVRASVFMVHGLNDWNVKSKQYADWWAELGKNNVKRKLWLHQGGHLDPKSVRNEGWVDELHRWFDQELLGLNTGIDREPKVSVEQSAGVWKNYVAWPDPAARTVDIGLENPLWFNASRTGDEPTVRYTDDPKLTDDQLAGDERTAKSGRVAWVSPELKQEVRLSGTGRVTIKGAADKVDTNLVAFLVDYGTDTRVDYSKGEGVHVVDPVQQICPDKAVLGDAAGCFNKREYNLHTAPYEIVTRGWLDAQHRFGLRKQVALTPGKVEEFGIELEADDYVFKPGHRIGIVLAGSERSQVNWDATHATMTVHLGDSYVELPVVGGKAALGF